VCAGVFALPHRAVMSAVAADGGARACGTAAARAHPGLRAEREAGRGARGAALRVARCDRPVFARRGVRRAEPAAAAAQALRAAVDRLDRPVVGAIVSQVLVDAIASDEAGW